MGAPHSRVSENLCKEGPAGQDCGETGSYWKGSFTLSAP